MSRGNRHKTVATVSFSGLMILAIFTFAFAGRAQAPGEGTTRSDSRIQAGFELAPVPLNLEGKNRAMVGLGSYLVNAAGCNDCHDTGPQHQFTPGHNPFFGQQEIVNPATYLGGGRDFGVLIPGSAHIISRNLTPDKTGRPEGGASFEEFLHILRTGEDMDHLHPTCAGAPDGNCVPPPFDGSLLQIMPWPSFKKLTDNDIRAIYEYLSAVPCVQGNYPGEATDRCQ